MIKFTVFVSFNEDFGYISLKMICPSSTEANDTYTCTCISFNWVIKMSFEFFLYFIMAF